MLANSIRKPLFSARAERGSGNVTAAVGIEETAGRLRARRSSLFSQTVIWVTGFICLAFLLGTLAQAWSNSQLMQRVQDAQQSLAQVQAHHHDLVQQAKYYAQPQVVENEARQQLGYIRPGEHAVNIISVADQNKSQQQTKSNAPASQGFWQ